MHVRIPTRAYVDFFLENVTEVQRLLDIHAELSGRGRGRRSGVEVLNKSAIVLLVSCWEAYLEDVAKMAFNSMVQSCQEPDQFPSKVRALASKPLKDAKDERKVWDLAGDGWRKVLITFSDGVIQDFHTPNSEKVDRLFETLLGMKGVSDSWRWKKMSPQSARSKLDELIRTRGEIAHRVQHSAPVHKASVENYMGHVTQLVETIDSLIHTHLTSFKQQITTAKSS